MYLEYFGLAEPPFRITPRTGVFFPGANRGATLEALIYAITHDEGVVKVGGAIGSGKTMLCRVLMKRLPAHVQVIHLANPTLSPEDVQAAVVSGLGLPITEPADGNTVQSRLQEHLERLHAEGRRAVVLIDEAHAVPAETLDEIRRLSSLESNGRKLLQLVLFGQPELNDILSRPDMRLLRDRITHNFTLEPLAPTEIAQYLDFRMRAAGYHGAEIFGPAAIFQLAAISFGLPRRINILADKALLAAFAADRHLITKKEVIAAIRDSEFAATARKSWRRNQMRVGAGVTAILLIAAIAWHGWPEGAPPEVAPSVAPAAAPVVATTAEPATTPVAEAPAAVTPPEGAIEPAKAASVPAASLDAKTDRAPEQWPGFGPVTTQLVGKGRDWLASAPSEHWFIQLIRLDVAEAARTEAIAAKASRLLAPEQLRAYAIEHEGARRIGLIYGDYRSYADAAADIDKFPAEMKALQPYPRQVMRLR